MRCQPLLFFIFVILLIISLPLRADNAVNSFDPTAANETLDKLSIKLSTEKLNVNHLQVAITILSELQVDAKKCVIDSSNQLNDINKQFTQTQPSNAATPAVSADLRYLTDKKNQLNDQLTQCRLFVMRSTEAVTAFNSTVQKLATHELLQAEPNILTNAQKIPQAIKAFHGKVYNLIFIKNSGIEIFTLPSSIILALLLIAGIIASIKIKTLIHDKLADQTNTLPDFKRTWLMVCQRYCLAIILLLVFSAFTTVLTLPLLPHVYLPLLSYGLLSYCLFLALMSLLFHPPHTVKKLNHLPDYISKVLARRLQLLASWCLLGFIVYLFVRSQLFAPPIIQMTRSIFVIVFIVNLISVIWLINRLPKLILYHPFIRNTIRSVFTLILLAMLTIECLGYHALSNYLLQGLVVTILSVLVLWSAHKIIHLILTNNADYVWQQKARTLLGLKPEESFPELLWLRLVAYLAMWSGFLLLLLEAWGITQSHFYNILNSLLHGFEIGSLVIIPARIGIAILLFTAFIASTRFLRTHLLTRSKTVMDAGSREALAVIFGYLGFALSTLLALVIAGVNFSGLAIIAGALSVGIGFGLQNIVNNFVSGIILLIERPIKSGDRIMVGDTEGYVRKISIRSTHIKTVQRADVIVPNSDLITKQVTNLTFYDKHYQVTISIGVAYGSDTALVQKLLLEIAHSNNEVISGNDPPQVYFRQFGDSTLNFDLVCTIQDVNNRSIVKSQLNLAVDKAFREHQIEMAFPQQEISIKNIADLAKTHKLTQPG